MATKCILWEGRVTSLGYPTNNARHRAWKKVRGPLPKGQRIHMICANKLCINVEHMFTPIPKERPKIPPVAAELRFRKLTGEPDEAGCWPWLGAKGPYGHGKFRYRRKLEQANRVAWMLAHGEPPAGKHVLHTCDNGNCVNPAHLYLGTHADNMRDKAVRNRQPNQKLSTEDVRAIRASPLGSTALARAYGVAQSTISNIRLGKRRQHE